MNKELMRLRGASLRRIEAVHIRPSMDIGAFAADFVARGRVSVHGRLARRVISGLASGESAHETDLLSYLLFDGGYAAELIELGRGDAAKKEEELVRFFTTPLADDERTGVVRGAGA
jgi:NTE family protein